MNFTIQSLFRVALIALIIVLLEAIHWPDITPYLWIVTYAVGVGYFFNPVINVPFAYSLLSVIVTIEGLLFIFNMVQSLVHFVSTGHFKPLPHVGEGGIGGDGYNDRRVTPGL